MIVFLVLMVNIVYQVMTQSSVLKDITALKELSTLISIHALRVISWIKLAVKFLVSAVLVEWEIIVLKGQRDKFNVRLVNIMISLTQLKYASFAHRESIAHYWELSVLQCVFLESTQIQELLNVVIVRLAHIVQMKAQVRVKKKVKNAQLVYFV